jgi:hypothetical protein
MGDNTDTGKGVPICTGGNGVGVGDSVGEEVGDGSIVGEDVPIAAVGGVLAWPPQADRTSAVNRIRSNRIVLRYKLVFISSSLLGWMLLSGSRFRQTKFYFNES